MTVYYVGAGGNDGNSGLTWALRKLTLNGAEDVPVVAGDIVYVAPGVYRELLTVDVAGGAGNPITYIGDYRGVYTDGVGGVVRVTGSDDDQAIVRNNCITANTKDYRTFRGFMFDAGASYLISATTCDNLIIDECYFETGIIGAFALYMSNATPNEITVKNCAFIGQGIQFFSGAAVTAVNCSVENNIFSSYYGVYCLSVDGVVIKNNTFFSCSNIGVRANALAALASISVTNCTFYNCTTALMASVLGEIVEDYNNLYNNNTPRTNVAVGGNSLAYPILYDSRWFFEAVKG